jgi:hypothetical protein
MMNRVQLSRLAIAVAATLGTATLGTATLGTMLVAPAAGAVDIVVPPNTIGLRSVPAKLVSVQRQSLGLTITLGYQLETCVDKLLPPAFTTEVRNNIMYVYVSTLNARGDASAVLCTPGPYVAQAKIKVFNERNYDANTIRIVNLDDYVIRPQ